MNSDLKELLHALNEQDAEYLIAEGYAVIFHTEPRFTKDLDIRVKPDPGNAGRLMAAFRQFGLPLIDIEEGDFTVSGTQYIIGVPPVALDFLTSIGELDFKDCRARRVTDDIDGIPVCYLGRGDLIESKRLTGRDQDRIDIGKLEGPGAVCCPASSVTSAARIFRRDQGAPSEAM